MIQSAIDAAATRGRVVIAGLCMAPNSIMPIAALLKEVAVRFAVCYRKSEFFLAASLLGAGRLDVDGMVTARVALDAVGEAFTRPTDDNGRAQGPRHARRGVAKGVIDGPRRLAVSVWTRGTLPELSSVFLEPLLWTTVRQPGMLQTATSEAKWPWQEDGGGEIAV
jgi:hypothetical protein